MSINFCDACDTCSHCSKIPEHKRPCQSMERQQPAEQVGEQPHSHHDYPNKRIWCSCIDCGGKWMALASSAQQQPVSDKEIDYILDTMPPEEGLPLILKGTK